MPKQETLPQGCRTCVMPMGEGAPADILQALANGSIPAAERTAWAAGFRFKLHSVTPGPEKTVMVYELENDPSFRPPM